MVINEKQASDALGKMQDSIISLLDSGYALSDINSAFEEMLQTEGLKYSYIKTVADATKSYLEKAFPDVADLYDNSTLQMFADFNVATKVMQDAQELQKLKSAGYEKAAPWEVEDGFGPGPALKVTKVSAKPAKPKDDDDILKVWSASL